MFKALNKKYLFAGEVLCASIFAVTLANVSCANEDRTKYVERPKVSSLNLSQAEIAQQLGWVQGDANADLCTGYYQQPLSLQSHTLIKPIDDSPTEVTAKGASNYRHDGSVMLQDHVVVTQPGRIAQADKAFVYRNITTGRIKRIVLIGHVKILEHDTVVTGSYAELNYLTNTLLLDHGVFHQAQPGKNKKNAWGVAKTYQRADGQISTLTDATFSLCPPSDPFWKITAKKITLDQKQQQGHAQQAWLHIKQIPLFYFPYFSFPTSGERKSGFLTPHFGYSSSIGLTLTAPYYLNLASNFDDLITPEWMGQHGIILKNNFRYLTSISSGSFYISGLPHDNNFSQFKADSVSDYSTKTQYIDDLEGMSSTRGYLSWYDKTHLIQHLESNIVVNYASDPYYYNEFETNSGSNWASQLLNQWDLQYADQLWQADLIFQAYQTQHIISQSSSGVQNQYQRLPELDFIGGKDHFWHGVDAELEAQVVNFDYSSDYQPYTYEQPVGLRAHLAPSVSYPLRFLGGTITPGVVLDSTIYSAELATETPDQSRPTFSQSRTLPIVDIDSAYYFERTLNIAGEHYLQTVEPRLFYLYVPEMNQDQYPVFDTQLLPINFNDLFATNAYTGYDRLQNANQMSWSLTSNILDPKTMAQKLRFQLGLMTYFEPQKVCLDDNCNGLYDHLSPLLGQASFHPRDHWTTTLNLAWDMLDDTMNNASANFHYSGYSHTALDFGYNFIHANTSTSSSSTDTNLISLGAARPITEHWSTVGYWYYNLANNDLQSYFIGAEYNACCWAARITANKVLDYSTDDYNTGIFVEFMLKGLGSVGQSASSLIRTAIPSYHDQFDQN